jgi:hypothetical protein
VLRKKIELYDLKLFGYNADFKAQYPSKNLKWIPLGEYVFGIRKGGCIKRALSESF